jgi:hypothetical protein
MIALQGAGEVLSPCSPVILVSIATDKNFHHAAFLSLPAIEP